MSFSKVQVDARLALKSLASPRSRKAVYAPVEALYYRYEGRQFFDLDFPTFAGLFAALTRHQLSAVAKAPDTIDSGNWPRATLDDSWSRLYREGRRSKPIWAALSLVAAHHALTEALKAQDSPPHEIVETCNNHVRWLKDILCRPDSRISESSGSATTFSLGTHDDPEHSRKRSLSSTSDSESEQCRKKRVELAHTGQGDTGCETLGIAIPSQFKDNGNPVMMEFEQSVDNVVSRLAPSFGSTTLDVGKFTTSRTPEPVVGLGSLRQCENGLNCWVPDNMADSWTGNSLLQSSAQPTETQKSYSTTSDNRENTSSDNTTLERCPFPIQTIQCNSTYNKSTTKPSGTMTRTSSVTWIAVPCSSNRSAALGATPRTLDTPSPQL